MRKIIVSEFLSLDGVMEAPDKWNLQFVNEEMTNHILGQLQEVDGLMYGRTTYMTMAGAWPSRTGEVADKFNNLPKYVISTTLNKLEWNNSHLINTDIVNEIKKLKKQKGTAILIWGSHQLVQTLLEQNLVDELKLYIHPIVLEKGKRLFKEGNEHKQKLMTLTHSKVFDTGVVALSYNFK